ncbi:MAG: DUF1254 domain-containing protein [Deltaproteobacteria bacterium]|nr:DUF1254 domain-containing protein [Deltaproteobacteria bacterium]
MKKWLKWTILVLAVAALFHLATVAFLPRAIMAHVSKKALQLKNASVNRAIHQPPVSADEKTVVMPCPDLLYTLCVYDVGRGPLRIRTPSPGDTYFSIALYASNTDNFFVVNDRMLPKGGKEIILVGKGTPQPPSGNYALVEAPTTKGILLCRILITDEKRLDDARNIQRQITIAPFR